ncbi:sulfurtransferase TusA family protein [Trichlorobacter ammonificans]|uniref:SirA-like protein n=1 Tax=Trichlorobacter ammonificans TaxID=2916410 RepID=A0ABM9D462_9BACT|nr:sulfurtransferase TusA family protein [Trichlorobacter ammonificans]CAH2030032.1 SirA-like protein [Trichlorobacter ammonificans]
MPVRQLDVSGLKCPQPVLRITVVAAEMKAGEVLEVTGDGPTFEKDVRAWCSRLRKTLLVVSDEKGYRKRIRIRF